MSQNPQNNPQAMSLTTDAEIGVALEAARIRVNEEGPDPYAIEIDYLEPLHMLVVHLSNRQRLALPVENLQGLENATTEQLRNYELHGRGYGFGFPELDADFYVDSLIEGNYGSPAWMNRLREEGPPRSERRQASFPMTSERPRADKVSAYTTL